MGCLVFVCLVLLVVTLAIGDQGDQGYHQDPSKLVWQLTKEMKEAHAGISLLDRHLDQQLAGLPAKVSKAATGIVTARQEGNHEYATIVSGVFGGRVLRNIGTVLNTATITTATALGIIGTFISSGAYAASRAVNIVNPNVDCGLADLNSVLRQYEVLTVLRQTYSGLGHQSTEHQGRSYQSTEYQRRSYQEGQGHAGLSIPASLQPQVLTYTVQDFGNELKTRLACLMEGSDGDNLERCIDATVEAMEKRLDATQDLIDIAQKLEIANKNYNSVQSQYV